MDKFLHRRIYGSICWPINVVTECVARWKMRSESISFAIQLYIKYQLPTMGSLLTISYSCVMDLLENDIEQISFMLFNFNDKLRFTYLLLNKNVKKRYLHL